MMRSAPFEIRKDTFMHAKDRGMHRVFDGDEPLAWLVVGRGSHSVDEVESCTSSLIAVASERWVPSAYGGSLDRGPKRERVQRIELSRFHSDCQLSGTAR